MAARTLLQIIQAIQSELGLPLSTSVITNTTDATTVQMLALANWEIEELRRKHRWTLLNRENNLIVNTPTVVTGNLTANSAVITNISPNTTGLLAQYYQVAGLGIPIASRILSVDSSSQVTMTMEATGAATATTLTFSQDTYPEPTDFDYFINDTWFDRTNRWRLLGPDSPQQDQFVRSGIVALGPRRHFRQLGSLANTYRLWPAPSEIAAPLQLVFEYQSTNSIQAAGVSNYATNTTQWVNDTDTPILNDRAIIMGVKARFWAQKGMAGAALMMKQYDDFVERQIARDGGAKKLSLVPRQVPFLLDVSNVQDSSFPGPTGPNSS